MATKSLTFKQKKLIAELDEICGLINLDYQKIAEYEPETRTTYLELAKNQLIRGQIVIWYTLVDELLSCEICNYFFGRRRSHIDLWKTKRFKIFNQFVIEQLPLLQKLSFVSVIWNHFPKGHAKSIRELNAVRNSVAHAFFPENLQRYRPRYKGKNVFSLEGIKLLQDDMYNVNEFLSRRIFH